MSNIQFNDILKLFSSKTLSLEIYQNLLNYQGNNVETNFIKIVLFEFLIDVNSNEIIKEEKELWFEKQKQNNYYHDARIFIDFVVKLLLNSSFSKISLPNLINEFLQNFTPSLKNYLDQIISILLYFKYENTDIFNLISKFIKSLFNVSKEIKNEFNKKLIPALNELLNNKGYKFNHIPHYPEQLSLGFFQIINEIMYLLSLENEDKEMIESFINYLSIYDLLPENEKNELMNWLKKGEILKIKIDDNSNIEVKNNEKNIKNQSEIINENQITNIKNNEINSININSNIENINGNLNEESKKIELNDKDYNIETNYKIDLSSFNDFNEFVPPQQNIKIDPELSFKINAQMIICGERILNLIKEVINLFLKLDLQEKEKIFHIEEKIELDNLKIKRLEILIIFLKNPYFVNLKRKIIEILLVKLLIENKDFIDISSDYVPKENLLIDLKNRIEKKIKEYKIIIGLNNNDKNYVKLLEDLRILENLSKKVGKNEAKIIIKENDKNNSFSQKLKIVYNFLNFYKSKLNPYVHISKDKSKFYLLPESCFKTNNDYHKYIYKISTLINEDEKNYENKIQAEQIYLNKKIIELEECWNILLSPNKTIKYYIDEFEEEINEYRNAYKKEVENLYTNYNVLFNFNFKIRIESEISPFPDGIKQKLIEIINQFKEKILNKIGNYYHDFISEENKIMSDLQKNYIKNEIIPLFDDLLNKDYSQFVWTEKGTFENLSKIYFIYLKLKEIRDFLLEQKKIFKSTLQKKEKQYLETLKKIADKMNHLKKQLEKEHSIESGLTIYKEWIRELRKNKAHELNNQDIFLDEIKTYLTHLIHNNIVLDMDFTYDHYFYLWLVKNNFIYYYYH